MRDAAGAGADADGCADADDDQRLCGGCVAIGGD